MPLLNNTPSPVFLFLFSLKPAIECTIGFILNHASALGSTRSKSI